MKESIIESRNLTKINATSDQTLGLFLIIFILTLPARIEIVSSQKICQMTEFKTECNDLTKKKPILVWNKSALFFDHLHSTLRSQDRNRCHEMIDPKIDVRAPFWRTFQWSVASHPFWEFGQWNSQQSPLWLTHVTFSTNTHPSTLQASTMQYKSAL